MVNNTLRDYVHPKHMSQNSKELWKNSTKLYSDTVFKFYSSILLTH